MRRKKFSKGIKSMLIILFIVAIVIILLLVVSNYNKDVSKKNVYFYSDGIKIAGVLYEK